jgi:hypothetical protein
MKTLLVIAFAVLTVACSKSEDNKSSGGDDQGPPPMPEAVQKRGKKACDAYVAHLCECAKNKPELELTSECELRKARPMALKTALDVLRSDAPARVKYKAQKTARKMISDCIERDNKLLTKCPR